ncbi:GHKL domain-containing protein [Candidatus Sumerlaeota bacterium]|nr:GHKL domain-containing protein [Candidatus Sumerlaeota bacterium]
MSSIRRRLTRNLLLGVLSLLLTGNLLMFLIVRFWLIEQFDLNLNTKVHAFAQMLEQERERVELDFKGELMPEYERSEQPEYFQLWLEDGQTLERSPSLQQSELPRRNFRLGIEEYWNLKLPDGRPGRAVGMRIYPEIDGKDRKDGSHQGAEPSVRTNGIAVDIMLARDRSELDRNLWALLLGSLLLGGAMAAVIGSLVPWLILSGLQPLNTLAEEMRTIDSKSLDRRFQETGVPNELLPIYRRMNDLLQRLHQAFQREKRLTADMAHELKTPIAELRAMADVALKWPDNRQFALESLKESQAVSLRMESIVETMLTLARMEGDRQRIEYAVLDLAEMIRLIWSAQQECLASKKIQLSLKLPERCEVRSNQHMLGCIINNLIDNAIEHCPAKGAISCELRSEHNAVTVLLENTNDALVEDDLPHLCEPLWRKDASRSGDNHAGLGLSIVDSFAQHLNLEVYFKLPKRNLFHVSLCFLMEDS